MPKEYKIIDYGSVGTLEGFQEKKEWIGILKSFFKNRTLEELIQFKINRHGPRIKFRYERI